MAEEEREPRREGFFERWSRVKTEARHSTPEAAVPAPAAQADEPPELPPLDKLDFDSDFRAFFHPQVEEGTRRAALKKLFSAPHFNVMDGLDVYIDDYSRSEPIPAAMLAALKQAQRIVQWAENAEEKGEGALLSEATAEGPSGALEPAPGGAGTAPDSISAAPAPPDTDRHGV